MKMFEYSKLDGLLRDHMPALAISNVANIVVIFGYVSCRKFNRRLLSFPQIDQI